MRIRSKPLERMMGKVGSQTRQRVLGFTALVTVAATGIMALVVAPPDAVQGNVQRLMYIHVPSAWLAYLSFFVVFVASIVYLKGGRLFWDGLAAASAEIGVIFTALTLVLGSLWGKPVWGTWWTWDPRLTTTAILLFIYLGYLAVRRLPDNPARKARWAAIVGIVGFVDVPIVHMSVVWWRSLHQQATVLNPAGPTIAPIMLDTLLLAVLAFTLLYAYLLVLRMRVGRLEQRVMSTTLLPGPEPSAADYGAAREVFAHR